MFNVYVLESIQGHSLKNQFNKFEKQPFANVLHDRLPYNFPNIHRKANVLKSLFNKVTGQTRIRFF